MEAATSVLDDAEARFRPKSVGLNLVQFADPGCDAIAIVERAAAVLAAVSSSGAGRS